MKMISFKYLVLLVLVSCNYNKKDTTINSNSHNKNTFISNQKDTSVFILKQAINQTNIKICDSISNPLDVDPFYFKDIAIHTGIDFFFNRTNSYYIDVCDSYIYVEKYSNKEITKRLKYSMDSIYNLPIDKIDHQLFDAIHKDYRIFFACDSLLIYFSVKPTSSFHTNIINQLKNECNCVPK